MIQFGSNDGEWMIIYNPVSKNKILSIEIADGIFSMFNYRTGKYVFEWRYK